jgi:three-Cys-motif partner protein
MTRRSDPNPAYWEQYGPFQHVKHELIRCYLNGWFPKLGTWAGRVLYVDTHAGRGRYESGDPGSPLVALQTLLNHSYREKLLTASEFNFLFIERDPANLAALEAELDRLRPVPARVNVSTSEGDAFERLSSILGDLRRDRARMAPAFLFVDPYGFKIPAQLLGDLMKAGRVELFINVMWRELDMLIQQRPERGTAPAQTLDEIFGSESWRTEIIGGDVDERLGHAIPLIAQGIRAKWWTSAVRMVTGGQATRYVLLHLTNSDDGRDLMKECAWSASPAGEFMVRRSDNPDQQFLIKPEPDLRPLRDWIMGRLSRRPERWQDLHAAVRPEWWLPKHVNEVVRDLKKDGTIAADAVPGRKFGAAANSLLRLAQSGGGRPRK